MTGSHEVVGSIPISSTNYLKFLAYSLGGQSGQELIAFFCAILPVEHAAWLSIYQHVRVSFKALSMRRP